MFDVRLAGISARAMFDSGATHTFVDASFVTQHQLHMQPSPLKVHPQPILLLTLLAWFLSN